MFGVGSSSIGNDEEASEVGFEHRFGEHERCALLEVLLLIREDCKGHLESA